MTNDRTVFFRRSDNNNNSTTNTLGIISETTNEMCFTLFSLASLIYPTVKPVLKHLNFKIMLLK